MPVDYFGETIKFGCMLRPCDHISRENGWYNVRMCSATMIDVNPSDPRYIVIEWDDCPATYQKVDQMPADWFVVVNPR